MTSLVQLFPSRITITPQPIKKAFHDMDFNRQSKGNYKKFVSQYVKNFSVAKNNFILSKSSKKKLLDSVNTMHFLSKARTIDMASGKQIYNFKLSFITLTLPATQNHTDIEIKKSCLNQFLIELRHAYDVNNYVWKAELQKNNNIHFHLVTDKYIDFQALRRRWNRVLEKLNYITAYSNKFKDINLSQYHAMRNQKAPCSFEKSAAAFAAGKRSNWRNPNSVDVKSVYGKKELAMYLAKYICKPTTTKTANAQDQERETKFGRSWSRSYSLANVKYQNKFTLVQVQHIINYLKSVPKLVKQVSGMYYDVFYFNVNTLCPAFKAFHHKFITANAVMYNYPFP